MDLATVTASGAVAALAAGEVGSVELLDALVARIDARDGELNAVVTRDLDGARAAARAADDARAAGRPVGRLAGLPVTIKDTFETAGVRTTAGAPELAEHVPDHDAEAVARLKRAGAVVFAKTNVPTYAAEMQTFNDVFGTTNNPWDPSRTPGGSSGGAAAALAAGFTLLELGSDIGGSIRAPAHYCGVFGHKPTWGAVPQRGHIPGPPGQRAATDLNVVGPLGRSVDDLALGMEVLAADLAGIPGAVLPPARPGVAELAGCRVGVHLEDPAAPLQRAVAAVLRRAVDAVSDAGAAVVDGARPATPLAERHQTYLLLLLTLLTQDFPDDIKELLVAVAAEVDDDDRSYPATAARAYTLSHHGWLAADEARARVAAEWDAVFTDVDVVLCPVTPVAAFPHDTEAPLHERTLDLDGTGVPYPDHLVWSGHATMTGQPATVVPVGRTDDGLPVGIQVIGPRWGDRTTLAVARHLEQLLGGFQPPPAFAG